MGSAIIAGVVAIIGALIGYYSAEQSNKAADERQQQNQDWQEAMMNKQNEYNTYSEQMSRLEDAGVNPATAFMGQSQVVGNTSAGVNSSPLLPVVDPALSMGNMMSALSGTYKSIEEGIDIKSTREARIAQVLAQAEQLRADAVFLGAKSTEQLIINKYADARENLARQGQRSQIHLNYHQSALFKSQERQFTYSVDKILPEELKLKVQQGQLNLLDMDKVIAEIADLKRSASLKEAQAKTEEFKQGNLSASTENLEMNTALQGAQRDVTEQEALYYSDIQEKYLSYYQSMIDNLSADTGYTEEQTFWIVFDKLGSTTRGVRDLPAGFGSGRVLSEQRRIARQRLRERLSK